MIEYVFEQFTSWNKYFNFAEILSKYRAENIAFLSFQVLAYSYYKKTKNYIEKHTIYQFCI